MKFQFLSSKRFVIQLILVFMVFILVITLGLGLPTILLMSRQTENQLKALIDQSSQTTIALLENEATQLQNLALLIAERPTLNHLLKERDGQLISDYLEDFLNNAQTDAIAVCQSQNLIAMAGDHAKPALCKDTENRRLTVSGDQVWWLSTANIIDSEIDATTIVVGQLMDSIFEEFTRQTQLYYLLFYDGSLLATNFQQNAKLLASQISANTAHYEQISFSDASASQQPFMAALIPVTDQPDFQLVGLLNIEPSIVINRQTRNFVVIILTFVSLAGIFLAVLVSQRISKPLNQLARSATALQEGDLTSRVTNSSKIWEIGQLTNALEDARISLKHSLDQLRMEKEWIESLLDSIVEGILTIDNQARITYASKAIEQMVGMDSTILLGHSVDRFFISQPGEDLFSHQIPIQNQNCRIPVILNDQEILISVSASTFVPPEAGNATRALVIRDVTDEEKIHRLMGEFMANITHEFRTPLSALSASVEILLDKLPDLSKQEIEQLLHALNIGIINLQSLIDNLLEAASIEGGRFKVNPKSVEFQTILDEAINTVDPIVKKHDLRISQPKNKQTFQVMVDQRRTIQALVNLFSNAIKHSPRGGVITLTTVILGKEVMIEVCDEGEGVSKDRQAQLFSRFITPSTEDDPSHFGIGLGLSVVKAIIEAQNGSVGFREGESGGAIFWITLPMVSGVET